MMPTPPPSSNAINSCSASWSGCSVTRPRPHPATGADARATLRSSTCAPRCCACAASISPAIDGVDTTTALKVIAEVGPDLSRFQSAKHFASWLGLCPGTKISGGKVLSGASKRTTNRLAQALRLAAAGLRRSHSALGAYYRRLCERLDKGKAVTATAHKLARLIYTMLTKGTEYVDRGQAYYEQRYRQRVIHHLTRRAVSMGFTLTPIDHVATENTTQINSLISVS